MKKLLVTMAAVLWLAIGVQSQTASETYFRFATPDRPMLDKLSRVISLDNVKDGYVYAYANADELAAFETFDLAWETLPRPGTLTSPKMARSTAAMADWDAYPTYGDYVAMMYQFQAAHPDICRIVNVGTTVEERDILFARISDNVATEEDEPEVLYTSSIHGDETTGYILCLRLIDSLLTAYGTDPLVTRLVDSLEIWINPLGNPDGTYHAGNASVYGATRYNANAVDLNRNYPDPAEGNHPDGYAWQPETQAMMALAVSHSFVLSTNYHGGEEVVNYPWDTWSRLHVDNAWYVDISHAYADTVHAHSPTSYMDGFDDGITNGYAWYRVTGGRQDYMNYWRGCREITIELSGVKLLSASQLPALWTYNRASLLHYLEEALHGVRGLVTDLSTGLPVAATVRALGHDGDHSEVFSDPDIGDYHRMLSPGTYDLEFTSPGYFPDTVTGVTVVDGQAVHIDVALQPMPDEPILALDSTTLGLTTPGGAFSFRLVLRNDGAGNAFNTVATVTTADPYIDMTVPSSIFPTIPALGGTAQSGNSFVFTVAPDCPRNHPVEFAVVVTSDGADPVYDAIATVVAPVIEDFETASLTRIPWTTEGDRPWSLSVGDAASGSYGAVSGAISHNQYSELSLNCNVAAPGRLAFRYKVSSEAGYDKLTFSVDGIPQAAWSGTIAWTPATFDLASGPHTMTWRYAKDEFRTIGQDCARIDLIIFPALVSTPTIVSGELPDWTVGQPYEQLLNVSNTWGVVAWSDSADGLSGTGLELSATGSVSGTPSVAGPVSFKALARDEANGEARQAFSFLINPAPAIISTGLPGGKRTYEYEFQLEASGGTASLTWSDISEQLAGAGLTLQASGLITGTTTTSGEVAFTAQVMDGVGAYDQKPFTMEIAPSCCNGKVGDANQDGQPEPTINDISVIIDMLYITNTPLTCLEAADVNHSGGLHPTAEDITIGDISVLIDHLYINQGPLLDCF